MSKVAHIIGILSRLDISDDDWEDALYIEHQFLGGFISEEEALRQLKALIQY